MTTIPPLPSKHVAGIYGIIHVSTSRIYVGSTRDIAKRWGNHRFHLDNNTHKNHYLQHTWNKYSAEAFEWVILEEIIDLHQLVPIEQKWIDFYHAANPQHGFNICPLAESRLGKKETLEQRKRKSERQKGMQRSKSASEATSKALKGNKNAAGHPRLDIAKLTEYDVCTIKARLIRGDSPTILAREYKVTTGAIKGIKTGKTWKHIIDFPPLTGEPVRGGFRNLFIPETE